MRRKDPALEKMIKIVTYTVLIIFTLGCFILGINYTRMGSSSTSTKKVSLSPEEAEVQRWTEEVKRDPGNPFNHRNLGLAYANVRKFKEAIQSYQKALEIEPKDPLSLKHLARLYALTGKPKEAVKEVEAAIVLEAHDPDLYLEKGIILIQAGDRKGAEAALKKTVELLPSAVNAKQLLLTLYFEGERYEEARKIGEELLKETGRDAAVLGILGRIHQKKREFPVARAYFEEALAKQPGDRLFLSSLGEVFLEIKEWKKAEETYRKILELYPSDLLPVLGLATSLKNAGKSDEAMKQLEAGLKKAREAKNQEIEKTFEKEIARLKGS